MSQVYYRRRRRRRQKHQPVTQEPTALDINVARVFREEPRIQSHDVNNYNMPGLE